MIDPKTKLQISRAYLLHPGYVSNHRHGPANLASPVPKFPSSSLTERLKVCSGLVVNSPSIDRSLHGWYFGLPDSC
jgi:hypothetical protein